MLRKFFIVAALGAGLALPNEAFAWHHGYHGYGYGHRGWGYHHGWRGYGYRGYGYGAYGGCYVWDGYQWRWRC
jgi:hypothetical protein